MKIKRLMMLIIFGGVLMVMSACGTPSGTSSTAQETKPVKQEEPTSGQDTKQADQEILIIIDQTPKPSEQKSFDFVVKQLPEGYSLTEMKWNSSKSHITNTLQEAAQHGANGEDGFYISGDGQFAGFMYPKSMSAESGEVKFLFHNEQGNELTWKKKITLK
ncbi:hypothetical protein [Paenibacillus guangzhouensis]|uniref:hypothetical protein n=1 Tax=Paenibacillus guangzhouensis TaxID=1473112 RepID=UPI00126698EF|nr:hypothetical protein [Paenibacillus guangzhouensis]